jgi:hypothetical protein
MEAAHVGIDPELLGDQETERAFAERARQIEAEALILQARLSLDHPMPKEKSHPIRRALHLHPR